MVAVTSALAVASAWTGPAPAALRQSSVADTVSCTTSQGTLQIKAFAHRPSLGYAGAFVFTGYPNTPATIHLLGVQTDTSKIDVDTGCSPAKKAIRFTHRGLSSAGVVKAGYEQSLIAYCGAPGHVFVRTGSASRAPASPRRRR